MTFADFHDKRIFLEALTESLENITIDKEYMDFISNAEKCTAFTLDAKHFTSLKYKNEIQFLITKHWFPEFNGFISGDITVPNLTSAIEKLKSISKTNFDRLFEYQPKGVGPGEILLYYVYNDARLGGGSSSGVDVIVGSKQYEVKSAKVQTGKNGYQSTKFLYDFKLGGTIDTDAVVAKLFETATKVGMKLKSKTEFSSSLMLELKQAAPKEYEELEELFRKASADYVTKHDFIFFSSKDAKTSGNVLYKGSINRNQIFMDRYTSRNMKPMFSIE